MHKIKSVLALVLTGLMVVLGGIFPQLLTAVTDRMLPNSMKMEPVTPLELQLQEQAQKPRLTTVQKLALLRNGGQAVYVGDEMMQSSRQMVEQAAMSFIRGMSSKGIIILQDILPTVNAVPCMIFNQEGRDYGMFWEVGLVYFDNLTGTDLQARCLVEDGENRVMSFSLEEFSTSLMENPQEQLPLTAAYYCESLGLEWTTGNIGENYLELNLPDSPELIISVFYYDTLWDDHSTSNLNIQIYEGFIQESP